MDAIMLFTFDYGGEFGYDVPFDPSITTQWDFRNWMRENKKKKKKKEIKNDDI